MSTSHRLVFGWGPTPTDPVQARLLGAESVRLEALLEEHGGAFRMYCHAQAVPELVAYVRTIGRDCTYEAFGETQALLRVGSP